MKRWLLSAVVAGMLCTVALGNTWAMGGLTVHYDGGGDESPEGSGGEGEGEGSGGGESSDSSDSSDGAGD